MEFNRTGIAIATLSLCYHEIR